ncbi:MAG: lamin tail domain-containing protein, partial [Chloroflexi bacterium]|nr:lamin tail domain-containing protein [Chloroflexota bacterium]
PLSSTSGGVYLFNRLSQFVDQVEYGFQIADLSVGRSSGSWNLLGSPTPGAANSAVATLSPATGLRLNEWLADSANEDDWLEVFNPNSQPVALTGLYLTDDPSLVGPTKFKVGPLSFIPALGWVKWIADGADTKGFDHVNFTLDSQGETLRIYNSSTNIIDSIDFGPQQPGVSEGRLPDGGASVNRFPANPTPGGCNYLPLTNPVINEVLSHTDPPLEDAIELSNVTGEPVPLGGWFISNSENNLKKYRIPEGTVLPASGCLVFYEQHFNANPDVPPSFTLNSAHGDEVVLSSADAAGNLTGHRAVVRFGAAENGVSFGRHRTSAGVDFVAMSRRSFGVDAPLSLAEFRLGNGKENAAPLTGPVVINEIMYHAPEGTDAAENSDWEFIELYNLTETDVALYDPEHPQNTWKLGNAVDFVFPRNTVLPAQSYLLVVGVDPGSNEAALEAFRRQYSVSSNTPIYGPWKGKLANNSQSVELFKPDSPQQLPHPDAGFVPYILADRVAYRDQAPWSPEADGSGASLQRLNSGAYGNEPLNWTANSPTAGRANDTSLLDADQDGLPNSWENAYGQDLQRAVSRCNDRRSVAKALRRGRVGNHADDRACGYHGHGARKAVLSFGDARHSVTVAVVVATGIVKEIAARI